MNRLICYIKGIIRSILTFNIVSGHDYEEIYDNKDIQILKCINCNHISLGFKGSIKEMDKRLDEREQEIERLNNIIEEIREYTKHKIVECYDEGSTIGEFYKICDIDSKIEELLHKGEIKSE